MINFDTPLLLTSYTRRLGGIFSIQALFSSSHKGVARIQEIVVSKK